METLVKQDGNLENTNNHSFFESKEHYLKFVAAWRKSIADGFHERSLIRRTSWSGQEIISKCPSKLTCVHHLIYNALRKKDLHKSFRPLTNKDRLAGCHPYAAFYKAVNVLKWATKNDRIADKLREPFGNTVTNEMLLELFETLHNVKL